MLAGMTKRRPGPVTISTRNLWLRRTGKPGAWREIVPDLMAIAGFFGVLYLAALLANAIAPYTQIGTAIASFAGS